MYFSAITSKDSFSPEQINNRNSFFSQKDVEKYILYKDEFI